MPFFPRAAPGRRPFLPQPGMARKFPARLVSGRPVPSCCPKRPDLAHCARAQPEPSLRPYPSCDGGAERGLLADAQTMPFVDNPSYLEKETFAVDIPAGHDACRHGSETFYRRAISLKGGCPGPGIEAAASARPHHRRPPIFTWATGSTLSRWKLRSLLAAAAGARPCGGLLGVPFDPPTARAFLRKPPHRDLRYHRAGKASTRDPRGNDGKAQRRPIERREAARGGRYPMFVLETDQPLCCTWTLSLGPCDRP